ncbi:hypothetical protein B6V01_003310 [Methanosarcinales archaeon ex4572_44]|nr:MAG: hypothetical protein B6U67_02240 [Methanosarcinales archaeon ex4484_138]PHP45587.1 MAG: hypothetical protein B6V01_003310 [Methanosarcinales archaeon ex4572_44]RLG26107.1 MAG: hypothetical protein DRN85_03935 [Methanosarcinales archaeon]
MSDIVQAKAVLIYHPLVLNLYPNTFVFAGNSDSEWIVFQHLYCQMLIRDVDTGQLRSWGVVDYRKPYIALVEMCTFECSWCCFGVALCFVVFVGEVD